jgi:hypothetical protein
MAVPNDTKQRFVAWLCTGPIGHLVAGALDWGELAGSTIRRRFR